LFHADGTLRNKRNNARNKPDLLTPDNMFVCVINIIIIIIIIIFIGNYHQKTGHKKRAIKKPRLSGARKTLSG
jgi:hypothetical protein